MKETLYIRFHVSKNQIRMTLNTYRVFKTYEQRMFLKNNLMKQDQENAKANRKGKMLRMELWIVGSGTSTWRN